MVKGGWENHLKYSSLPIRLSSRWIGEGRPHSEHCLNEMRNISERSDTSGYGIEAKCFIVIDMDNQNLESTTYVERPPAPGMGDPLNYDSFLQRACCSRIRSGE